MASAEQVYGIAESIATRIIVIEVVLSKEDMHNWDEHKKLASEYQFAMENILRFPVPMKVDMSWGPSWGEQHA